MFEPTGIVNPGACPAIWNQTCCPEVQPTRDGVATDDLNVSSSCGSLTLQLTSQGHGAAGDRRKKVEESLSALVHPFHLWWL